MHKVIGADANEYGRVGADTLEHSLTTGFSHVSNANVPVKPFQLFHGAACTMLKRFVHHAIECARPKPGANNELKESYAVGKSGASIKKCVCHFPEHHYLDTPLKAYV